MGFCDKHCVKGLKVIPFPMPLFNVLAWTERKLGASSSLNSHRITMQAKYPTILSARHNLYVYNDYR